MKRPSWIIETLALFTLAVALLGTGDDRRSSASAAGFALLGAAVVRGLDGRSRQHEREESDRIQRVRDLDETRRVLYIAYAAAHGSYEHRADAAGTAAHALAHHSMRLTPEQARGLAVALTNQSGLSTAATEAILEEIAGISDEIRAIGVR